MEYIERSVDEIYNSAMQYMDDNKYMKAYKEFTEVERLHPYSIWATRAQLMTSYANYKLYQYEDSISGAKRYIELHPGASAIDYAFYLISLALGVLIISVNGSQVDLLHVLFGSALALHNDALYLLGGISTLTLVVLALVFRPLVLECMDRLFLQSVSHLSPLAHFSFLMLITALFLSYFIPTK